MARTIRAGWSLGLPRAPYPTFGTLGIGLSDGTGKNYALSCSHVVAAWNNGNAKGQSAESPAAPDQSAGKNPIGTVDNWAVLGPGDNTLDAGVVLLDLTSVNVSNGDLALSSLQTTPHLSAPDYKRFYGQAVHVHSKRGTLAAVVDQLYDGKVFGFSGRDYSFSNVLAYNASVDTFAAGDSGSAVTVDLSAELLGIHFAADNGNRTGYCILTPIIWTAFSSYAFNILP